MLADCGANLQDHHPVRLGLQNLGRMGVPGLLIPFRSSEPERSRAGSDPPTTARRCTAAALFARLRDAGLLVRMRFSEIAVVAVMVGRLTASRSLGRLCDLHPTRPARRPPRRNTSAAAPRVIRRRPPTHGRHRCAARRGAGAAEPGLRRAADSYSRAPTPATGRSPAPMLTRHSLG